MIPYISMFVLGFGGLFFLLLGAFIRNFPVIKAAGLVAAVVAALNIYGFKVDALAKDNFYILFAISFITAVGFLSLVVAKSFEENEPNTDLHLIKEYGALMLLAMLGMVVMVCAKDFMTLYLGMELESIPLCVLAIKAARPTSQSAEAGVKFFILKSVASALFLFGMALVYGYGGSLDYSGLRADLVAHSQMLQMGYVMVLAGLLFNIGVFPFHMWLPDVYQGTFLPVNLFMSVAPKFTAFFVTAAVAHAAGIYQSPALVDILKIAAIGSMLIGSLMALCQTNLRRIMAYSTVSSAGFALIGIITKGDQALNALLAYLTVYGIMMLGCFAFICSLRGDGEIKEEIEALRGMSKDHPMRALMFSVLLLSLAGLPPFAGFFAKIVLLIVAVNQGYYYIAIAAALSSVFMTLYFLKLIALMYFYQPISRPGDASPTVLKAILRACSLFAVLFGVVLGFL